MPISTKPTNQFRASDIDVDAFLNKGEDIPQPKRDELESPTKGTEKKEKPKNVQLRLLPSKIAQIDALRTERRVPVSRHHWFMEAIEEKLEREERDDPRR